MHPVLWLALAIGTEVVATTALKLSDGFRNWGWGAVVVVGYAISFYDATTARESLRSKWWGPKTDPKQLYGGFGLIRIPVDSTGQATARRIWRRFDGEAERLIHEIPDNVTTKYQDDVL